MLNFSKINAFEHGQRESFEELICLLAKRQRHNGVVGFQRIEGSGGDGGIEALWLCADGSKLGYQAKYFLSLGSSQWSQIDESVKRALEVHPELTKYVVALPINLTNKRTSSGRGRSGWEQWAARVESWTGLAKAKGLTVTFELWTATDINEMLLREENQGLVQHWFGKKNLGNSWFKKNFLTTQGLLDERYSPSEHVHLSLEAMFDAIARGPSTMAQIRECYAELSKQNFSSIDFKKLCPHLNQSDVDQAERALINLLDTEKIFSLNYEEQWQTATIHELLDVYRAKLRPLEAILVTAWQARDANKKKQDINHIQALIWGALSAISHLKRLIESKNFQAERMRCAVVTGPAGAGKSHLLAHIADQRLSEGEPTILLIGQSFSDADVWGQIGAQLDIPERTSAEILGLLNAAAERQGKRALVMIDAINEGIGASYWQNRIAGLLTQAKEFPSLAFIFSCREEYLPFALPQSVINNISVFLVNGFETIQEMEAAAEMYLDSKGIARPNTPWLSPEFRNPLFLKSTSKALQERGEVEFPKGLHGISQLMSFYLDSLSMRTGLPDIDHDLLASTIKRTVLTIAAKMVETREDYLNLEVADSIANEKFAQLAKPTNITWLGVLTRSSVLRRDPPPLNEKSDPLKPLPDRIRFAFQRFQDHLMAQAIVDQLEADRLNAAFDIDGALSFLFFTDGIGRRLSYKYAGLLGALSTLYPERFAIEFADTFPDVLDCWAQNHMLQEAFGTSCQWRRLDAFTDRSLERLNSLDERYVDKLALLVEVSMTIDHPWNAIFLHNWLINQTMPDRDSCWTDWVNRTSFEEGNQVERLISWANGVGKADVRHLQLAGLVIAWLLTSSRRSTRDRASKALTSIFLRRSTVFERLLSKLADCNDPYLIERLYGSAFGACCLDQSTERLSSYARVTWETCFACSEPPVALLTRDYALGIIELAKTKNALSAGIDLDKCAPPFNSAPPDLDLHMEDIEKLADKLGSKAIFRSASTEWGDFGKYTIPGRVRPFLTSPLKDPKPASADEIKELFVKEVVLPHQERIHSLKVFEEIRERQASLIFRSIGTKKDMDSHIDKEEEETIRELLKAREAFENILTKQEKIKFSKEYLREGRGYSHYVNIDIQQCRLWITKRAYELGWTNKLFPKDGHGTYGSRYQNDLERIGKKYQWIALDEIIARLADNQWYLNEWPSFPIVYKYSHQNLYRDIDPTLLPDLPRFKAISRSDESWMIEPNVRLPEVLEADLKDWPFQEDPTKTLQEKLQRIDSNGNKWRILYEFNCEEQSYAEPMPGLHGARYEEFRFVYCAFLKTIDAHTFLDDLRKHQSLDVSEFKPREYIDGPFFLEAYWRDTWSSEKFSEEIHWASSGCKFSNPVASYYWESHMDKTISEGFSAYLPQKWLAKDLGIIISQENIRSWVDSSGVELIKVFEPTKNKSVVLIREDTLLDYCEREKLTSIWLLVGERNVWPGGDNEQSCWRRSEGAWWESDSNWEHIAWNKDKKR